MMQSEELDGALLTFAEGFHFGAAALDAAVFEELGLVFLEGVEVVEEACGCESQGCSGFAGGPDVDETVEGVFALLDALFVANGAGLGAFCSAEPAALVANDGLDSREQLGGGHETDGDARTAEHGFDDFAVIEVGNDDAILDGVAPDNAAGGDFETEDGVACGGELVDQFLRC